MSHWRDIPGFSRYQASDDGRIRSIGMTHNGGYPFVRTPTANRDGYLQLKVRRDGEPYRTFSVHSLVALAFYGPLVPGMEVNHKDGDKKNNSVVNLEYVTDAGNKEHAAATGLNVNDWGDEARNCRFLFEQVQEMRTLRSAGWLLKDIAQQFQTSKGYVCDIVRGNNRVAA